MVAIHGGGFNIGSGNGETDMMGPGYIMDRDVVLVTFNYRLGALGRILLYNFSRRILGSIYLKIAVLFSGFMTTGDGIAPGNYGLLDQSLALRFVS